MSRHGTITRPATLAALDVLERPGQPGPLPAWGQAKSHVHRSTQDAKYLKFISGTRVRNFRGESSVLSDFRRPRHNKQTTGIQNMVLGYLDNKYEKVQQQTDHTARQRCAAYLVPQADQRPLVFHSCMCERAGRGDINSTTAAATDQLQCQETSGRASPMKLQILDS